MVQQGGRAKDHRGRRCRWVGCISVRSHLDGTWVCEWHWFIAWMARRITSYELWMKSYNTSRDIVWILRPWIISGLEEHESCRDKNLGREKSLIMVLCSGIYNDFQTPYNEAQIYVHERLLCSTPANAPPWYLNASRSSVCIPIVHHM